MNVREVLGVDGDTILFTAVGEDPASTSLWTAGPGGVQRVSPADGVHGGLLAGRHAAAGQPHAGRLRDCQRPGAAARPRTARWPRWRRSARSRETPDLPAPKPLLTWSAGPSRIRTAILLPSWHKPGSGKLPVLCDPYGGPHGKRVLAAGAAYLSSQWFAEQGFAVVVADGRGTPGRGPEWDRAVAGDLAGPVLEDQVEAL